MSCSSANALMPGLSLVYVATSVPLMAANVVAPSGVERGQLAGAGRARTGIWGHTHSAHRRRTASAPALLRPLRGVAFLSCPCGWHAGTGHAYFVDAGWS